jgi:putative phosphoribosyl transferase
MRPCFEDRSHAGRLLADRLVSLIVRPCVVAAIARGGVAVAEPIAERLRLPMRVLHVGRLTPPRATRRTFGALCEDGTLVVDPETVARLGLGEQDVERARERVAARMRRRRARFSDVGAGRAEPCRSILIVDDGMHTGLTLRAAIMSAYRQGAADITVAVPCASSAAALQVHLEVHGLVCPRVDAEFEGIAGYYADFDPVTDEDVVAMLAYTAAMGRTAHVRA